MNLNVNSNASFGSKARRFTRRLSYGISKVIRDWNGETSESRSNSKSMILIEQNPRVFNIDDLVLVTKFSRREIQFIYRDFKIKCPDGILTENGLVEIYSQLFSCGDTHLFSKHLFSAMNQQVFYTSTSTYKSNTEINFRDFVIALSSIMRGTLDDRIKWLFNFYDINKDGKISQDEIESMVRSLYDLMGQNVNPPVDEMTKHEHIYSVVQKLGLDMEGDTTMSYNEFYELFSNNQELIEKMMNVY